MTDLNSVRAHVEVLQWARAREAEIKEVKDNAVEAIKAVLGDSDVGELDGDVVVRWGSYKKRQLDQAAMRKHHPDIVESYTNTVEVRRFTVE